METSFVQVSFQHNDIQKAKKYIPNVFFVLLMPPPTASRLCSLQFYEQLTRYRGCFFNDYSTSYNSAVNSPANWPGLVAAFKADLLVPPFVTLSVSHC
jgi:hypothetical protein